MEKIKKIKKVNLAYLEEAKNMLKNSNCEIINSEGFINSQSLVTVKCNNCNFIWTRDAGEFKRGRSCPECAMERRKNNLNKFDPLYLDKILSKAPDREFYQFMEPYKGDNKIKHDIKHLECGTVYPVRPNDFQQGYRCPECSNKLSRGELMAIHFFEKNNIDYRKQEKIAISGKNLKIDFYLPGLKLYMEIDGEQHFNRYSTWYDEPSRERGLLKNAYFIKNELSFIRVPFCYITKKPNSKILEHVLNDIKTQTLDHEYLKENKCFLYTRTISINLDHYFEINEFGSRKETVLPSLNLLN